jgi:hypothetical protein
LTFKSDLQRQVPNYVPLYTESAATSVQLANEEFQASFLGWFRFKSDLEAVRRELDLILAMNPIEREATDIGVVKVAREGQSAAWSIQDVRFHNDGSVYVYVLPLYGFPGLVFVEGDNSLDLCFGTYASRGPVGEQGPVGFSGIRGDLSSLSFSYLTKASAFDDTIPPSVVEGGIQDSKEILLDGHLQFQSPGALGGEQWIKFDPEDIHGLSLKPILSDIHSNRGQSILGAISIQQTDEKGNRSSIQFHILQIEESNDAQVFWLRVAFWTKDANFVSFSATEDFPVTIHLTRAVKKGEPGLEEGFKADLMTLISRYDAITSA